MSVADGAALPWSSEHTGADELFALLDARPSWHASAACRDHPELSWFPGAYDDRTAVLEVCGTCPVIEQCRDFAVAQPEPQAGIWGGTTARQRRRLRAETGAKLAPVAAAKVAKVRTPAGGPRAPFPRQKVADLQLSRRSQDAIA